MKKHFIFCCVIFALITAVYFNSLKSPFMYDDINTIVKNPYFSDFKNFHYVFTKNYFSFFSQRSYRLLCTVSFFVNYSLFKLNPTGYHVTNTLFHFFSAALVYFLIFTATKNFFLSLFTSLLFAAHPIQTEAVNSITFREDLMAMAFSLLSLLAFIKSTRPEVFKKVLYYAVSLFSFILGILSKETALVTPLVIILYDFTFIGSGSVKNILRRKYYYFGFSLIVFFYFIFYFYYLSITKDTLDVLKPGYPGGSLMTTFLTMTKVILYYIKNLLLPVSLCVEYGISLSRSLFEPVVLFSIALLVLLFAAAIKLHKKHKEISFGLAYFFITLLPVSNIIPLGHLMNDRHLYMPSLGFCLIVSYLLLKLLKNKTTAVTVFSLLLIFYSAVTIKQNIIWQDGIRLWGNVIEKYPDFAKAYNGRGFSYDVKGDYNSAIADYNRAIELAPNYSEAYNNRGIVYSERGDYDRAIADFNKAVTLNPSDAEAYNNRGIAYATKGFYDESIKNLNKAIELNPNNIEAYNNRGIVHYKKGLFDLAREDLKLSAGLGDEKARKILKQLFNIEYKE